jgi:NRPS condensation-like uncharacterized protein
VTISIVINNPRTLKFYILLLLKKCLSVSLKAKHVLSIKFSKTNQNRYTKYTFLYATYKISPLAVFPYVW